MDYSLVEKWLGSGEEPPRCPYLVGKGSSYYCLKGGEGLHCPIEVVSGRLYMCEGAMFVSRYNRLMNERVKL